MLQLHGDEGPAYCREAARRTGAKVMKAVRVRDAAQRARPARFHTDFHLLDAYSPRTPGGTGETLRLGAGRRHPGTPAGGALGRARRRRTWAEAIEAARPFAVDTASGTEAEPGRKDPAKLDRLLRAPCEAADASRSAPRERAAVERRFGPYGGRYVPETLIPALDELEREWLEARADPGFNDGARRGCCATTSGGPTPLYRAARLSEAAGGEVWLKREDLTHTGSHKINNALGQALLARRMGKPRMIAETGRRPARRGVGHGVRAARARVHRLHGHRGHAPPAAERRAHAACWAPRWSGVEAGARTLKEAVSRGDPRLGHERRDAPTTSSAPRVGPAPYPALVRDLQRTIGDEARAQLLEAAGRLPDRVIACVGGGSNAIGTFVGVRRTTPASS